MGLPARVHPADDDTQRDRHQRGHASEPGAGQLPDARSGVFVVFSLGSVLGEGGGGITAEPFWNPMSTVAAVSAGAALTAYSFIGFDAVSTFAEETKDPTRTVPRAIILTALVAGSIFVFVAFVVQLVHPGGEFANPDSAALDIARDIAGNFFAAVFLATVIVAQFTAGIPIQAAGARLMFAMGRDGVLPRQFFGRLHPRFHTPAFNLCLTGAVGLLALGLSVTTSTSFVNFGAFTAFAFVNLSVIAHYVRGRRGGTPRSVVGWVVFPLIGLAVVLWLMSSLDPHALTLGGLWLVLGFGWLLYLTRGLRQSPPEMTFEE
nr:APC family permease [Kineosphaera limosa]